MASIVKEARYAAERSTIPVTLIDIDKLAGLLISNTERLMSFFNLN